MKSPSLRNYFTHTPVVRLLGAWLLCFGAPLKGVSQITTYTYQNLSFGAFTPGNAGGTVTIAPNGTRTATGDVIAVNMGFQYFPAIFEVDAPQGTIINIVSGPDVRLTGPNGAAMTLRVGTSDPVMPFIATAAPPEKNTIKVGATLVVGAAAANPPGAYSGTFSLTFVQE